jgi:hypothetical protein
MEAEDTLSRGIFPNHGVAEDPRGGEYGGHINRFQASSAALASRMICSSSSVGTTSAKTRLDGSVMFVRPSRLAASSKIYPEKPAAKNVPRRSGYFAYPAGEYYDIESFHFAAYAPIVQTIRLTRTFSARIAFISPAWIASTIAR